MTIIIPCSLGNSCCPFGFLIFTIDKTNFLYYSLYILTEKSLKHLCSIRAWVPMSFFLSFSLSLTVLGWFLGAQRPVLLTFLPGLLRPSREGALCLHPPREGARCLRERCKSCVKDFIGFLRKPGSYQPLSLFHFLIVASGPPGPCPIKDPNSARSILYTLLLLLSSKLNL